MNNLHIKTHWIVLSMPFILLGWPFPLALYDIATKGSTSLLGVGVFFLIPLVVGFIFLNRSIDFSENKIVYTRWFIYKYWPFKTVSVDLNQIERVEVHAGAVEDSSEEGTLRLVLYGREKLLSINWSIFDDKELIPAIHFLASRKNIDLNELAREIKDTNLATARRLSLGPAVDGVIRFIILSSIITSLFLEIFF